MSDFLQAIEPWTEVWGASLWRASWQGAIVIAIAWIVARSCTFLSPRLVCWVWRLACFKLLVAIVWVQPVDIALLPAHPKAAATPEAVSHVISKPESPAQAMPVEHLKEPSLQLGASQVSIVAASFLLPAWLIGVVYCMFRTARQWYSVCRLLWSSELCSTDRLLRMCRQEAQRLGVRRLPQLRFSPRVESPLLVGVWQPSIILPDHVEEKFDETECRLMIAHELAHLQRHDLSWNWLPTVANWLFFFHPFVWVMIRRWSEAQEAACDEVLIQRRVAQSADYGRLLLKLSARSPLESHAALVAVGVLGAYRNLEQRILKMTRVKPFSARRLSVAASLLVIVGLMTIVPWRLVAQELKDKLNERVIGEAETEKKAEATPPAKGRFVLAPEETQKAETDPVAQRALERLRELGANPARLQTIGIQSGWKGTDADLNLLNDLPDLRWLYLELDLPGAEAVGGLKLKQPLKDLILGRVSDALLAKLLRLPGCVRLTLAQYMLSTEGCRRLAQLAEGIESLEFNGSSPKDIDDDGLKYIGQIRSLKGLQLFQVQGAITDEGLSHLGGLDKLEDLTLIGCTGIRGPGYANLAPIKSLQRLSVFGMPIGADGFEALAKLTQLEALNLRDFKFPPTELQAADVKVLKSLSNLRSLEISVWAKGGGRSRLALGNAILTTAGQTPSLRSLVVHGIGTSADGLEALVTNPSLEELFLDSVELSDRSLAAIGRLIHLRRLGLGSEGIVTDAVLAQLAQLEQITQLDLSGSELTDDGLRQLASLHALERLNLPNSKITGTGLASLSNLKQLKTLTLSNSPFSDEGSKELRGLSAIEWLNLSKTKITDRALDAIGTLANLRMVSFDDTSVSIEGLMKLRDLKRLGLISIVGIEATNEDMARLQAALSGVQISRTPTLGGGAVFIPGERYSGRNSPTPKKKARSN